jgi:hypothetical protein
MAATSSQPSSSQPRLRTESQTGWIVFAALLLALAGGFNIFYGLAGLLNDEVLHVGGRGVLILDFTVWGWVHLVIGALMLLTSFGLINMSGWARWAGIAFAMINAMVQFASITAFPIATLLMIVLDVVIVFQLTARWDVD